MELPHDGGGQEGDVGFGRQTLRVQREVNSPASSHQPFPGGGRSPLPRLSLPHGLELRTSPLFHLDGPALGRGSAHPLTTAGVGVGVGVHHRETDVVQWRTLETAVVQSRCRTGLRVDPGPLLRPLVVEGGGTAGEGRGLVGVRGREQRLGMLPVVLPQKR